MRRLSSWALNAATSFLLKEAEEGLTQKRTVWSRKQDATWLALKVEEEAMSEEMLKQARKQILPYILHMEHGPEDALILGQLNYFRRWPPEL